MATPIASLAVNVTSRTAKFEKGMKRATKSMRGFRASIPGANLLLNKFTAIAGAVSVGALALWTRKSLAHIDALGKLSDRLDVSVGAIQAWQRAGDLAGVGQDDVNKSLEMFTRRMGEVREGVGEGLPALEKLNLLNADFMALPMEEKLLRVADGFAGLGTQEEKAAAAADLFGRSGVKMVNLLQRGAEPIEESREQLRKWGIELSRIDVSKVEAANDRLGDLKRVISGSFDRLVVELAPFIEGAARAMLEMAEEGGGAGNLIVRGFEFAIKGVGKFMGALEHLKGVWLAVKAGFTFGTKEIIDNFVGIADAVRKVAGFFNVKLGNEKLEALRTKVKELGEEYEKTKAKLELVPGNARAAEKQANDFVDKLRELADKAAADLAADAEKRRNKIGIDPFDPLLVPGGQAGKDAKIKARLESMIEGLKFERTLIGKGNVERARMVKLRQFNSAAMESETIDLDKLRGRYEAVFDELESARKLESIASGIGDAFGNFFETMIDGSKKAAESIRELGLAIAQMVARKLVLEPAANFISGAISNIAGALFAGPTSPSPTDQGTNFSSYDQGFGSGPQTVQNVVIQTPDIDSFGRSRRQIADALNSGGFA